MANRSRAELPRSQAGVNALSQAVHSQSQNRTSVQEQPDLHWAQSAEQSKQRSRSEIEKANRSRVRVRVRVV